MKRGCALLLLLSVDAVERISAMYLTRNTARWGPVPGIVRGTIVHGSGCGGGCCGGCCGGDVEESLTGPRRHPLQLLSSAAIRRRDSVLASCAGRKSAQVPGKDRVSDAWICMRNGKSAVRAVFLRRAAQPPSCRCAQCARRRRRRGSAGTRPGPGPRRGMRRYDEHCI